MVTESIRPPPESELVWQFFDARRDGFFLDVGANEPQKGSQTWVLEERGWRGILIEPQAKLCERLRQARPRAQVFQVACGAPGAPPEMPLFTAESPGHSGLVKNLVDAATTYIGTEIVKVMTLDAILAEAGNPRSILSRWTLKGRNLTCSSASTCNGIGPNCLLMEDHLYDLKAHRYLGRAGYRLAKRTGLNNWYVPKESSFGPTSFAERYRLWKKVWANTPLRKMRVFFERRKAGREHSE